MAPESRAERGKRMAGVEAAAAVFPRMVVGLGTGSTVAHFLRALAARIRAGELPGVVGVATSIRTENEAGALGIPLSSLEGVAGLDLTVDGADEVDPGLNLIKGMGGALLREKMVAQASRRFLIIVDEGKLVTRLGTRSPLPVEVVPFAWRTHVAFMEGLGAEAVVRMGPNGEPFLTDNGNHLLECRFADGIQDPPELQDVLLARAGIVDTGLFLDMADRIVVGGEGAVEVLDRDGSGVGREEQGERREGVQL